MEFSRVAQELGEYITVLEAEKLLALLEKGESTREAVKAVFPVDRRPKAIALLKSAEIYDGRDEDKKLRLHTLLCGILGAKTVATKITPVWTMPANLARKTQLTTNVAELVRSAQTSIVCATYNFQDSSRLREALEEMSTEYGLEVKVYVDGEAGKPYSLAKNLPNVAVFGSCKGQQIQHIKSHAKFIIIDSEKIYISSANFSKSAEIYNVELGVIIEDRNLAEQITSEMRDLEVDSRVYKRFRVAA